MIYRVVYIVSDCREEYIEADSVDEAKSKWENEPNDGGELFFIESENGDQVVY